MCSIDESFIILLYNIICYEYFFEDIYSVFVMNFQRIFLFFDNLCVMVSW